MDKTLRAVGATVVLFGIALAALLQAGPKGDPTAIALAPEEIATTITDPAQPGKDVETTTSTEPVPFVYRIGVLSNVSTDNFWAFFGGEPSVWDAYVLGPTKASLYAFDGSTSTLIADLAASSASPSLVDGVWQVAVELRSDAYWSDGEPITAHDYVFTFETVRALGLGGNWAAVFPPTVESVRATSDHEIIISFDGRPPLSVWPNGPGVAPVMAHHVWAQRVGDDASYLLSASGVSDVSGGSLVLERIGDRITTSSWNGFHRGASGPDVVEYHVFEDEVTGVNALARGDIDTFLSPKGLAPAAANALFAHPDIEVVSSAGNGVRYLGFNLTREPMSDIAFREALALLLDKKQLAASVSATTQPAFSLVDPGNTHWFDVAAAGSLRTEYSGEPQTRLNRALEGLRSAGYAWAIEPSLGDEGFRAGSGLTINGRRPAPLTILTPGDAYDPARPETAARIAETLGVLGFDVRPVETDFDTVVDLAFTPGEEGLFHYDMYLLGWTLGNPALPDYYRPLFASDGAINNTGYASAAFDEALGRYEAAIGSTDAKAALWEMEYILSNDLPYLLLYRTSIIEAYRADRIRFDVTTSLGGIQGRLGGIADVTPARG